MAADLDRTLGFPGPGRRRPLLRLPPHRPRRRRRREQGSAAADGLGDGLGRPHLAACACQAHVIL